MPKITVAVLFGGRSTEHEISIITGHEIINAFDTTRYTPIPVYIDQRGRWFTGPELMNKDTYRSLPGSLDSLKEVTLLPVPKTGGLTVVGGKKSFQLFGGGKPEVIPVDVFFPAFHGQFGEDGCIQGLFEMADVAFTGCGVLASALAMNKYICKTVLQMHGVPVLPSTIAKKSAAQKNLSAVREQILGTPGLERFPLFVKPVNLGSSIGVGKADDAPTLDAALARVFQYDIEAIVEPCVTQKLEVNVSVRDTPHAVASVTETPVSSGDLLSYEDKYLRGGGGKKGKGKASGGGAQGMASLVRVIDPPDLAENYKSAVLKHAVNAYQVLSCSGVVRFDFMIDLQTERLYFNELNPLPGSMAHYLWEKSAPPVLYPELLDDIVQSALSRKELQSALLRDVGFKALFR
ncbi:MAG: D-alanine--D-alanine ligase [Bdellovibrionota bacterium]